MLPSDIQAITDECLPLLKQLAVGRYGVAISGSFGKGTFDQHSDLDFRLYGDDLLTDPEKISEITRQFQVLVTRWQEKGYRIDDYWPRKIADIDRTLEECLSGTLKRVDYTWTIWGYHILPDVYHQYILDDPFGVMRGWKERLSVYPPGLKQALLEKHLASVRYWRADYHYLNKVRRQDVVFLSGLTSRLVHDVIQILFALNETYYVGDGNNLEYAEKFAYVPENFSTRVEQILFPGNSPDTFMRQREQLVALINDAEKLVETQQ